MGDISTKQLTAEVKAATDGELVLYAAAFGNVDRTNEVIEAGAFKNLPEFVASGWIAINHDWDDLPVASVESAEQDGYGLKLTCKWHSTPEAQKCRTIVKERMERGKAVKCSIGYRVLEDMAETRDGKAVRILKSIELYEASIVNLPANPAAHVTSVKGWVADLDAAYVALKEGRVLSTRSRDRLASCRDRMKEACDELSKMLDETGQEEAIEEETEVEEAKNVDALPSSAGRQLYGAFLAHEARFPSYLLRV
jgi:uncharacterized protein